jgi:hypothetical protein
VVAAGIRGVTPTIIFYLIGRLLLARDKSGEAAVPGRHWVMLGLSFLWFMAGTLLAIALEDSLGPNQVAASLVIVGVTVAPHVVPSWLAWRVCGPWGWLKAGRACLAFSGAGRRKLEREGARVLYRAAFEPTLPDLGLESVNPWSVVALVVEAERRGDVESAARLADGLEELPPEALLSRRWRRFAVELLTLGAARRGDWREVERRLRLGRGRGVRFLRLLAKAHLRDLGERPSRLALWWAWALAPWRRQGWVWLDAALAAGEASAGPPQAQTAGPWAEHLRLLATAAAGSVPMTDIAALTRTWEGVLDARHEAEWIARGLELGARAPAEAYARLRSSVLREMDALLDAAAGPLPEEPSLLWTELLDRRRDHLLAGLKRWTAPFGDGVAGRAFRPPIEEWTEWVTFRRHVLRLASCGPDTLATAWHNGLRLTACNWPVFLHQTYGAQATWAVCVMYVWSSWLATWVGDERIRTLSQDNYRIAYRQAAQ